MTLFIDDRIFQLQSHGGISNLWRNLAPHLQTALQSTTFEDSKPDLFMSTYYGLPQNGFDSVVLAYDFIAERYPAIGAYHVDAVQKRTAIQQAKAVIAISQWVANDVQHYCGKVASVAHCGTTLRRASPEQVQAFKNKYDIQRPYVLTLGRRASYKNAQVLYQAWPFFAARDDCMVLCVGGEENTVADNQFKTQYPSQWERIYIMDNEMPAAITGAEMLVYPSFYEGFGLPVLEAMACGTPVICGNHSAIPEFAEDSPYYCDVYRPISVAEAMNEALQADFWRQSQAMARAKTFTWERMAQDIIQAIKDIPDND